MKTNTRNTFNEKTHEGAPAHQINAEQQLRRSVMACMLWESTFYESGEDIAKRIAATVAKVDPAKVAAIAVEARGKMKLRHAPLLVAREMARLPKHKGYVKDVLYNIIQRSDELSEFLSLYWKDGRQPLSAQVKKGLALAFRKFDEYQLAKYNRDNAVKLRDVMFLVHPEPKDEAQEALWKRLVDGELTTPDTWEVALSAGKDKKETWTRLIREGKLGGLALLRNLRNMREAAVDEEVIFEGLEKMKTDRILPFRFIAAARYAPQFESQIEKAMFRCIEGLPKLPGRTILLVDVSGSMGGELSDRSDMLCWDAATGLAVLARELCEKVGIYTFSDRLVYVPDRHGFALRDAVVNSQPHYGTRLGASVEKINKEAANRPNVAGYDRLIVITDEQSHDRLPDPVGGKGYVINVAAYQNGVGYGAWTHIDGFSEAVLDYIREVENLEA